MKKLLLLGILCLAIFSFFSQTTFANIWGTDNQRVIYCQGDDCSLEKGIEQVRENIDGIETEVTASEYIQRIIVYLMTFVTIIAVIYIIYAGFRILTSAGDDEAQTNAKKIILSVAAGIALMWLSYSIVNFILSILM